jgi:hypothetical protein
MEERVDAVTKGQHLFALFLRTNSLTVCSSALAWMAGFLLSAAPGTTDAEHVAFQVLFGLMCMRTMLLFFSSMVSTAFRHFSFEKNVLFVSAVVSMCFIFSGFLIPPDRLPEWTKLLQWLNPFYWSFGPMLKLRILSLPALHGDCVTTDGAAPMSAFQCMSQSPSAQKTSLLLVLQIFKVGSIDIYSYLLILLLLQAAYATSSYLFLSEPWKNAHTKCQPMILRMPTTGGQVEGRKEQTTKLNPLAGQSALSATAPHVPLPSPPLAAGVTPQSLSLTPQLATCHPLVSASSLSPAEPAAAATAAADVAAPPRVSPTRSDEDANESSRTLGETPQAEKQAGLRTASTQMQL